MKGTLRIMYCVEIKIVQNIREPVKNYSADFFRQGVPPPPGIFSLKGLKMMFLYLMRLKMEQKSHIIDQEGIKMYEKRQEMEFLNLKYLIFSGIGGCPDHRQILSHILY